MLFHLFTTITDHSKTSSPLIEVIFSSPRLIMSSKLFVYPIFRSDSSSYPGYIGLRNFTVKEERVYFLGSE